MTKQLTTNTSMMTTDRLGQPCRGYLIHVTAKGKTVIYGTGKLMRPLCLKKAAEACRTALRRKLKVVVETHGTYSGRELMTGAELLELAEGF